MRRRGYHKLEALFRSRKLRYVVFGMCSTDMLLHRAISFLLYKHAWLAIDKGRALMYPQFLGKHSRQDISYDNCCHLGFVEDKRPHCWHQQQKRNWSGKLLVALQPRTIASEVLKAVQGCNQRATVLLVTAVTRPWICSWEREVDRPVWQAANGVQSYAVHKGREVC